MKKPTIKLSFHTITEEKYSPVKRECVDVKTGYDIYMELPYNEESQESKNEANDRLYELKKKFEKLNDLMDINLHFDYQGFEPVETLGGYVTIEEIEDNGMTVTEFKKEFKKIFTQAKKGL